MSEQAASYRRILKSSSIIGGASVANIAIGLVRTKVLALLLGPTGVGLVSLYRALMTTGTTVATMGLDIVGTRQIAEASAREDQRSIAIARRAIFWSTLALGLGGGLLMWLFRAMIARRVLGSAAHAGIVGWLALGLVLSVAAASQGALIQGMRQIGDIARVAVNGGILSTVLGLVIVWRWRDAGLVFFVLAVPLASFIFGWLYVSRLPKIILHHIAFNEMARQWKMLLAIGLPFMGGALAMSVIQLWIRVDVTHVLGTRALGQFQSSWTVSAQYITLVLGAMGADYYPRLTGVIHDHTAAVRLVNEQTEIGLLLSGPIFLAMMGLAPWVLRLLYTADFVPAAVVLRWMVLSDVLKVASWPLGFILLAAGDGKTFFWTETASLLVMGVTIAGLLGSFGLQMTGIGYLACYIFYLPLVHWLAKRRIGFSWNPHVRQLLCASFILCGAVGMVAVRTHWGVPVGCVAATVYAIYSLGRLSQMSDIGGPVGRIGAFSRRLTGGRSS